MKKAKLDFIPLFCRQRYKQLIVGFVLLYVLLMCVEIPLIFHGHSGLARNGGASLRRPFSLQSEEELTGLESPLRPRKDPVSANRSSLFPSNSENREMKAVVSGLLFADAGRNGSGFSEIQKSARDAWEVGRRLWEELVSNSSDEMEKEKVSEMETCPHSINLKGEEFFYRGKIISLPCGLTMGSHITVVGKPYAAHVQHDPKISALKEGQESVLVSQFIVELKGLKFADGEDPPRVFHFNPRLKGDWSGKPVIEQNTCYRMQWGTPLRCEGWKSIADEETVDGQLKCEKWTHENNTHSEESKVTWWLSRLIGQNKRIPVDWPYPFAEDKLFVLTLSAGLEGYHVSVDGRHVTSFPYRTGFTLEDATGFSLNGDIYVLSIVATSLPTSQPSFASQSHLEMYNEWRAPPLPEGPVKLFVGILSAGNHFAERMAVRKSWMQSSLIRSSNVLARFFVALHGRKEVNAELKKEAEFFGDIVIVPFLDAYDLVVMKTVAICEYGVHTVSANYVMKCDDDTFVRVESVMEDLKNFPSGRSLYLGNINYYHKPLREGKWAVTYEEWPEEDYPPYANGAGYVISADIANFVVTEFEKRTLRLFKMEDVSMGMWVEKFNSSIPVDYVHDFGFCQYGCIEDYYTAHYQSPRQMICLWEKLKKGEPQCCNGRS